MIMCVEVERWRWKNENRYRVYHTSGLCRKYWEYNCPKSVKIFMEKNKADVKDYSSDDIVHMVYGYIW